MKSAGGKVGVTGRGGWEIFDYYICSNVEN